MQQRDGLSFRDGDDLRRLALNGKLTVKDVVRREYDDKLVVRVDLSRGSREIVVA
jgi:hypothetical protein